MLLFVRLVSVSNIYLLSETFFFNLRLQTLSIQLYYYPGEVVSRTSHILNYKNSNLPVISFGVNYLSNMFPANLYPADYLLVLQLLKETRVEIFEGNKLTTLSKLEHEHRRRRGLPSKQQRGMLKLRTIMMKHW